MSASIEKSLYIGMLKTRFDLFDDVKLKLKNGEIVAGEISGFEECSNVCLLTESGWRSINVDDIEGYIPQ